LRFPLSSGALQVWGSPYTPVFGRQELELLQAIGSLADLALERVRMADRDAELAAGELADLHRRVAQGERVHLETRHVCRSAFR
jgi:GAF domain-containing protein